ncbi:MAG: type II toxin-antitoxin system HicB family antitoxin, partial [Solirubrobacteraceae bacterium]
MGQRAPAAERLLKLPYHIVLVRDGEGDDERRWTARVQELPGCEARERTSEEAARAISHAMEEWLDAALQRGA